MNDVVGHLTHALAREISKSHAFSREAPDGEFHHGLEQATDVVILDLVQPDQPSQNHALAKGHSMKCELSNQHRGHTGTVCHYSS